MSNIEQVINAILIQPYRVFDNPLPAFWFGTACLALLCVIIGNLTGAILYKLNKKHYEAQNNELDRLHTLSIRAANTGNKETFKAVNSLAHESFGKNFFTGVALFSATLWPLPFALGWMSERFADITVHTVPWINKDLGYTFVMLSCYIGIRLLYSRLRSIWEKLIKK